MVETGGMAASQGNSWLMLHRGCVTRQLCHQWRDTGQKQQKTSDLKSLRCQLCQFGHSIGSGSRSAGPAEPVAAALIIRANLATTRLRDASPGHSDGIIGHSGGPLIRGHSQPQARPPARVTSQSLRGPHQVGLTMQVGAGYRTAKAPNAR
jgi:hypothetical protein